jgi:hypothetical protein
MLDVTDGIFDTGPLEVRQGGTLKFDGFVSAPKRSISPQRRAVPSWPIRASSMPALPASATGT